MKLETFWPEKSVQVMQSDSLTTPSSYQIIWFLSQYSIICRQAAHYRDNAHGFKNNGVISIKSDFMKHRRLFQSPSAQLRSGEILSFKLVFKWHIMTSVIFQHIISSAGSAGRISGQITA